MVVGDPRVFGREDLPVVCDEQGGLTFEEWLRSIDNEGGK